jgi:hypothetical protein
MSINTMKKIFGIFIIIFCLVFAGSILVKYYQIGKKISASVIANTSEFIRVINQKPYNDGVIIENRIYVTDLTLSWPGFVAVYENPFDKYGTLVGTSKFLPAGKYQYVPVDLVKEYKTGQRLYVLIYKDNGDSIYNLVQDPVVKDFNDVEIMDDFVIK